MRCFLAVMLAAAALFSEVCVGQGSEAGRAVLPNGREIRAVGTWVGLAPYPFAIALRRDGSEAAIPSIGFPFALNVVSHPDGAGAVVRRLPERVEDVKAVETHAGVAYSPDGMLLYVATGDSGRVAIYRTADWTKVREIPLDGALGGRTYGGSFAAALIVSRDGRWVYVVDQGNWRVAVVDTVCDGWWWGRWRRGPIRSGWLCPRMRGAFM